jgi:hypothetical protein
MLRNKKFWALVIFLGLFIGVWASLGFVAALVISFIWFILAILIVGAARKAERTYYVHHEGDRDIHVYHEGVGSKPRGGGGFGTDMYVPRVSRKGSEFITGASSLRKHQRDAMRRTKKNLWG